MLVGGEQVGRRDAAAPHLGLERLDEPLDGFLGSAADGRERRGLPFGQHCQEAAGGEHALDRKMNHVVGNDPLLRTGDGLGEAWNALPVKATMVLEL